MTSETSERVQESSFPPSNEPRVWFITAAASIIGISVAWKLLEHGDHVVAGVASAESDEICGSLDDFKRFEQDVQKNPDFLSRLKVVSYDIRSISDCQSAIALAIKAFARIDVVLCCNSESVIGTVEELAQDSLTRSTIHEMFNTNFFSPVNIIRAVLPPLRAQHQGHIILLSGITGHLGTPGLSIYCASQWAIEGYCDSLAYEIAPFNIRMSIVQSNFEVLILTNKISAVPSMDAYSQTENQAPMVRSVISRLLDRLEDEQQSSTTDVPANDDVQVSSGQKVLNARETVTIHPPMVPALKESLIAETVYALLAIGGHDNPPARHIVGFEGIASVKEKLKTVSEELEEFVEVSQSVDI